MPERRTLLVALLASFGVGACFNVADVGDVRADSITIAAARASLVVGDTVRIVATPRKRNGNPATRAVGFSSSDVRRATVTVNGLVTAVSPGTVRITASSDGRNAHVQIVVRSATSM